MGKTHFDVTISSTVPCTSNASADFVAAKQQGFDWNPFKEP